VAAVGLVGEVEAVGCGVVEVKPIRFRAYADDAKYFWVEVRVFGSKRDMQRDIKKCVGGDVHRSTSGQVNNAVFRKNGKKLGCFAVMWLNRKDMLRWPSEVAAHESVHAAMRYFERRRWSPCLHSDHLDDAPDPHERRMEERLAYAVGRINRGLTRGLFRHGVWK
jgi:hypothetical protein